MNNIGKKSVCLLTTNIFKLPFLIMVKKLYKMPNSIEFCDVTEVNVTPKRCSAPNVEISPQIEVTFIATKELTRGSGWEIDVDEKRRAISIETIRKQLQGNDFNVTAILTGNGNR